VVGPAVGVLSDGAAELGDGHLGHPVVEVGGEGRECPGQGGELVLEVAHVRCADAGAGVPAAGTDGPDPTPA